ncbi:carboxylesterase family protein [Streptomyces sp. NPDC001073]
MAPGSRGDGDRRRSATHLPERAHDENFGNLYGTDRPWTSADRAIADRTSSYVANFVATGNPNGHGLPSWPELRTTKPQSMEPGDRFAPLAAGAARPSTRS